MPIAYNIPFCTYAFFIVKEGEYNNLMVAGYLVGLSAQISELPSFSVSLSVPIQVLFLPAEQQCAAGEGQPELFLFFFKASYSWREVQSLQHLK